MARPPRQDEALLRRSVLALARRDVLAAGGAEGLSLRAIARELGYSPGSLYRYYGGRDDLLRALAAQASARMRGALTQALSETRDGQPLVAIGMAYVQTSLAHPDDLLLAGLLRTRSSLQQAVPDHSPYRILLAAFEDAVARGALPPLRLEEMAYGLWALVHGAVELRRSHLRGFDADLDGADRRNLRALLRGYAAGCEATEAPS